MPFTAAIVAALFVIQRLNHFIFRIDSYSDAAAGCKFRAYFAPARLERGYQIIKHYIGNVFVENAFIAERP
jgi:hypothetical protein